MNEMNDKKLNEAMAAGSVYTPPVVEFSDTTNLLEQADYKFSLQDREKPNLYRQLFDYDSIPKVAFNHRMVPISMPAIIIARTT